MMAAISMQLFLVIRKSTKLGNILINISMIMLSQEFLEDLCFIINVETFRFQTRNCCICKSIRTSNESIGRNQVILSSIHHLADTPDPRTKISVLVPNY
mmetsp:Transcript_25920/g.30547  ORF Transcript_25920/g.30547 Transcript_25920/m.30547 type:complete len:99 (+) Transcript_25920:265-561(+)